MQSIQCPFCNRTIQPLELALRGSAHHDGRCELPVDYIMQKMAWPGDETVLGEEDWDS